MATNAAAWSSASRSPPVATAGGRRSLTIVALLAAMNLVVLLVTSLVGYDMSHRYERLVADFDSRKAQHLTDVALDNILWNEHVTTVTEIARAISANPEVRTALQAADATGLGRLLEDEFGRAAVTSGTVALRGIIVLDTGMKPVASAWDGPQQMPPAEIFAAAEARDGIERLQPFVAGWLADGTPRITVIGPIGGLRLLGFVALQVDPVSIIAQIEDRLSMDLTVRTADGTAELASPDSYELPAGAVTRSFALMAHAPDGRVLALLDARIDVTELSQALDRTRFRALLLFVVVAGGISVVSVVGAWLVLRAMQRRQQEAAAAIEAARANEAALMAERKAAEHEAEIARAEERRQQTLDLANDLDQRVKTLTTSVMEAARSVTDRSSKLAGMARQSAGSAQDGETLCRGAREIMASTSAACDELRASIQEIARQTTAASTVTTDAARRATDARQQVGHLGDASKEIAEVVGLISAIAEQTNLLALNATIEAARAGEAGKGFAVVAAEVKNLASQTAKATEDIGGRVAAIRTESENAIEVMGAIADIVGTINETLGGIASAVEEQTAATAEIARNVNDVSGTASEIAETVAGVRGAVEETEQSCTTMNSSLDQLSGWINDLDGEVSAVVANLRNN